MAQPCPAGQQPMSTQIATGFVRVVPVPGSAGGIPSGVMMKAGFRYVMTATGSIRVGVFGETGTPPDGWEQMRSHRRRRSRKPTAAS
jgi:hypothetical protein